MTDIRDLLVRRSAAKQILVHDDADDFCASFDPLTGWKLGNLFSPYELKKKFFVVTDEMEVLKIAKAARKDLRKAK